MAGVVAPEAIEGESYVEVRSQQPIESAQSQQPGILVESRIVGVAADFIVLVAD